MTLFTCRPATDSVRTRASQAALGLLAAASLWGAAAAVQAGDPPPANPGQAQTTSSKSAKPDPEDRVTCRDEDTIGTRLGGKRVCHTQREWKQIARDGQELLNSIGHTANPPGK